MVSSFFAFADFRGRLRVMQGFWWDSIAMSLPGVLGGNDRKSEREIDRDK